MATPSLSVPAAGSGLLTVSVSARTTVQFKFLVLHGDGAVTWENAANHSYAIPASGVGSIAVNWLKEGTPNLSRPPGY